MFKKSLILVPKSLIKLADKDKFGEGDYRSDNEARFLLAFSAFKKFIEADYLTFQGIKRDGGNTKKFDKFTKSFGNLTLDVKKVFN